MAIIFIRTLIIYTLLILITRLMGKRHIGELEISELVGTLILSEIATAPIENKDIPIIFAVIPMITIATIEIIISVILIKFPNLKSIASTRPSPLIEKGIINQKELTNSRISIEELISELRQQNISDINEVNYAILEQNGKISVILKSQFKQPSISDMKIPSAEKGITHILVSNGYINNYNLKKHNKSLEWLQQTASSNGCTINDIYLLLLSDSGEVYIIKKEKDK